jgi:enoyl-CoA hydratase
MSHSFFPEENALSLIDMGFPCDHSHHQENPTILVQYHPALKIVTQLASQAGVQPDIYKRGGAMAYNTILFKIEDGLATLTFNRPDKLNALNREMAGELREALEKVAQDPSIRVLVFSGEGRSFMAGADITTFLGMDPLAARRFAQRAHDVLALIEGLEIPVIAAVHGYALGGGFEIALACDFIYAATGTKFGLPEITLGFIPGVGGTQRLARLVGRSVAKEMIMTGRFLDAEQAHTLGLVAQVFPEDTLKEETQNIAEALAKKGRLALRSAKQAIDRGADVDLKSGCSLEMDLFALCFASPDAQEGVKAFLEKRQPEFQGELP